MDTKYDTLNKVQLAAEAKELHITLARLSDEKQELLLALQRPQLASELETAWDNFVEVADAVDATEDSIAELNHSYLDRFVY